MNDLSRVAQNNRQPKSTTAAAVPGSTGPQRSAIGKHPSALATLIPSLPNVPASLRPP